MCPPRWSSSRTSIIATVEEVEGLVREAARSAGLRNLRVEREIWLEGVVFDMVWNFWWRWFWSKEKWEVVDVDGFI